MVARGQWCIVECAVREDGETSPARTFLEQLGSGSWPGDPDEPDLPSDAQIRDCDKLLAWCQMLADDGVPYYTHAVNYLRDGMWEFKIGAKRLSFFDTTGDGNYTPKPKLDSRPPEVTDEFWWFPSLDPYVRLGHAFPKTGQKTKPTDIAETLTVRKEDVSHDKPS